MLAYIFSITYGICIRFRKIPQLDNVFKYCKIYVFIYKKYFLGKYILTLSFVFSKNNMEKKYLSYHN